MPGTLLPLSDRYRAAICFGLLLQVPCAVVGRLLLDGGRMARLGGATMLGFWLAVAVLIARRPSAPAWGHLAFIRWGFWPLFAVAVVLAQLVG